MNNKKTPSDFATTSALNAIIAVTALTGIVSNMGSKALASDSSKVSYNTESQKSLGSNGLDMITYNTTTTQSLGMGQRGLMELVNDDSHTETDS